MSAAPKEDVVNPVAPGTPVPHVDVFDEERNVVDFYSIFEGKKGIVFGVPGAFTPTCSSTHVPGYIKERETLLAKGIEVVACISVNDAFVMQEWAKSLGTEGKVRMLADQSGALSRALGVADSGYIDKLGSMRCRRFAMIIENNAITTVKVEQPSSGGAPTCSFAPDILSVL
mmetsp:Transcript_144534/g.204475  ORF Transcript_144534/g.204475 Transcript_144534/m.204475 type:complete len:172 (-) Transcript_144534:85-600(-)